MSNSGHPLISIVGEDGILVEFEHRIAPEINRQVRQLAFRLEQAQVPGVTEVVPAFRSLMLYFNTELTTPKELSSKVRGLLKGLEHAALPGRSHYVIPTVYGGAHGPDLNTVAESKGMEPGEVVKLFSTQKFTVYCLGFLCGLPNLGSVPAKLHLPRLSTPRTLLPAGSVGMAGAQAVVLPIALPSGFHYLGRTFVRMYDPAARPPTPIKPGDLIECRAVSEAEARKWEGRPAGECLVESFPGN